MTDLSDIARNASPDVLALNREVLGAAGLGGAKTGQPEHKESKYHAVRTGHYQSKKEARFAAELALRQQDGEISFWLEQVPFQLEAGYVHKVDFAIFKCIENWAPSSKRVYDVEFVETKGRDLPMGKLKRKQTEKRYGIHIEVV